MKAKIKMNNHRQPDSGQCTQRNAINTFCCLIEIENVDGVHLPVDCGPRSVINRFLYSSFLIIYDSDSELWCSTQEELDFNFNSIW